MTGSLTQAGAVSCLSCYDENKNLPGLQVHYGVVKDF